MAFWKSKQRSVLAITVALIASLFVLPVVSPATAAVPAESFISDNIQKSLSILNDPQLSDAERGAEFERLLLGLTDMRRVAVFTLGQYAENASPRALDDFAAAFQNYSVAVYRAYLSRYAGQTLRVTGCKERAPDDFIVTTVMVDSSDHGGQPSLEVDFRVRTNTGRPELTDFSVGGVWLALEERDQFCAWMAHNHSDIQALVAHLDAVADSYR
jgi:phospholipid transport system substrate-binding protein